ncbi:hypothetical protein BDN72DRAFT_961762 [Pluteus cervinus]|uniref:Uncharacterized protein n=1 Tax=Pluteus cervinus TaxID=181527 RepID=A0ACD3AKM9_9AGAR|nr:hypothetical protein BDN72DRAFT_961762 [Pluteus cervinus]
MKAGTAFSHVNRKVLGPMPPQEFMNAFLPARTPRHRQQKLTHDASLFHKFSATRKPELRYQRWVDALEPYCGPNVIQVDTHEYPVFHEDGQSFGPQVCVYLGRQDKGFEPPAFLDMKTVEMSIHFSETIDPFSDDDDESFECPGDREEGLLGEISLPALTQLSFQYRTHVFSMLVLPKYVRFLRWDRAGVIVTGKIPLAGSGHLVTTFFQRMQSASPCTRGIDETVTTPRLSTQQEKLVRQTLNLKLDVPLLQVKIGGRRFIFANSPFFTSYFARSTRCFKAYNLDAKPGEGRCGVFKDSWRMFNGMNEFERYQKLSRAGVKNIPTIWCGEDVMRDLRTGGAFYHKTRTQDYQFALWTKGRIRFRFATHRHYRHVVEELEGPLTACRNIKDVVTALQDASQAHAEAFDRANIMHADSSITNVMIKYEGDLVRGYLIDWDLSIDLDDEPNQIIQRSGQWIFMSARLTSPGYFQRRSRQDQVDDVESFFHDLVYTLVFYTRTFGSGPPPEWAKCYFVEMETIDGYSCGGTTKLSCMRRSTISRYLDSPPLKALVEKLSTVLYSRYTKRDPSFPGNLVKEAQDNSALLYSDPYWLPKALTDALAQPGWLEEKLLTEANDPEERDLESTQVDWDEIAKDMKERTGQEQSRKKRRLH